MGIRQILLCWWNLYFLLPCRLDFCLPPPMISLYFLNWTESHVVENKECMMVCPFAHEEMYFIPLTTIVHLPSKTFGYIFLISQYSILCLLTKAWHINGLQECTSVSAKNVMTKMILLRYSLGLSHLLALLTLLNMFIAILLW